MTKIWGHVGFCDMLLEITVSHWVPTLWLEMQPNDNSVPVGDVVHIVKARLRAPLPGTCWLPAGLSVLLPLISLLDRTGKPGSNQVLWRRKNFGEEDSDGGEATGAGRGAGSLGGGLAVWGLPGTSFCVPHREAVLSPRELRPSFPG